MIELQAGDEQQQLALERRKAETLAQCTSAGVKPVASIASTQSRCRLGCIAPVGDLASIRSRSRAIAAISHCRLQLRPAREARDRRRPQGFRRRVHAGTVICWVGSKTGAGPLRSSSTLSAPSTRRRTQCGPAGQAVGELEHQRVAWPRRAATRGASTASSARSALCSRRTCGRDASVTVTRGGAPPRIAVAAGRPSPASAAMTGTGARISGMALVSRGSGSPVGVNAHAEPPAARPPARSGRRRHWAA